MPPAGLAARAFTRRDFADAYAARLPQGAACDVEAFARAFFTATPRWAALLMALRDRVVAPLGLKTSRRAAPPRPERMTFQPGDVRGIFRVFAHTENEILIGEDDRHLDFRVGLVVAPRGDACWVTIPTVVRYNTLLGRLYFLPVRFGHRLIVPAMLREAVRRLAE